MEYIKLYRNLKRYGKYVDHISIRSMPSVANDRDKPYAYSTHRYSPHEMYYHLVIPSFKVKYINEAFKDLKDKAKN